MKRLSTLILLVMLPMLAFAQGENDDRGLYDNLEENSYLPAYGVLSNLFLINTPTASLPGHGEYRVSGRMMGGDSWVARTEIGIKDRFSVGVAWGMLGLLGSGDVDIYEKTGLSLRLRLAEEGALPALLIGFDNQGYGPWDDELKRYARKSKGFYLSMTRSWYGAFGSDLATSLGVNYSLEREDEASADAFFGLEQHFDESFSLLADYELGLDDRKQDDSYGEGNGWLDLALNWKINDSLSFKFILADLLKNGVDPITGDAFGVERQMVINFGGSF
jgi:hypothetical protein